MVKLVSINSKEDIQRINRIACEQPFDMSLSSGSMIVDAKSLLAGDNFKVNNYQEVISILEKVKNGTPVMVGYLFTLEEN